MEKKKYSLFLNFFLFFTRLIICPQGGSIHKHIINIFISLALFVDFFICIYGKTKIVLCTTIMVFVLKWNITAEKNFFIFCYDKIS